MEAYDISAYDYVALGDNKFGQLLRDKSLLSFPKAIPLDFTENVKEGTTPLEDEDVELLEVGVSVCFVRIPKLLSTFPSSIFAVGCNSRLQLGISQSITETHLLEPVDINEISLRRGGDEIVSIASGFTNSYIITLKGRVFASGSNISGQLGYAPKSKNDSVSTPTEITFFSNLITDRVKSAHGGHYFVLFLMNSGLVYSLGSNSNGELGLGDLTSRHSPTCIDYFKKNSVKIKTIITSRGGLHVYFVSEDDKIYRCGWNRLGVLGTGSTELVKTPLRLEFFNENFPRDPVVRIASGGVNTLFLLRSGKIFGVGGNANGELGMPENVEMLTKITSIPFFDNIEDRVVNIEAGFSHTLFQMKSGTIYGTGLAEKGQLGVTPNNCKRVFTPFEIVFPVNRCPLKAIAGNLFSVFQFSDVPVPVMILKKFYGLDEREDVFFTGEHSPILLKSFPLLCSYLDLHEISRDSREYFAIRWLLFFCHTDNFIFLKKIINSIQECFDLAMFLEDFADIPIGCDDLILERFKTLLNPKLASSLHVPEEKECRHRHLLKRMALIQSDATQGYLPAPSFRYEKKKPISLILQDLYDNSMFSNLRATIDKEKNVEIALNQFIISLSSLYFQVLLENRHKFLEREDEILHLFCECNYECVENQDSKICYCIDQVLRFMYGYTVDFRIGDEFFLICELADKWQISSLVKSCLKYLRKNLTLVTSVSLLNFVCNHEVAEFVSEFVKTYCSKHFKAILEIHPPCSFEVDSCTLIEMFSAHFCIGNDCNNP
ncbi:hypothetical protein ABK040_008861 [Willaertia magna]